MSHIICHLRIPKDSDAKVTTFIKVQLKYHKLHLIHAMNQHLFVNLPSFAGITVIQFQNMFLSSPQDPSCPLIPIPYPKSPPISFLYTRNISLESSSVLSWKLPCVCIHRNKYRCDLETYGYYTSHAFRKLLQLQDAKLDNTWGKFCDKSHSSSHSSLRINCPEYKTEHWHLLQWIPVTLKSIRQTCSTWSPSWPAGPQHSNSFHLWWSRWVKRHYGQKQIEKEPNGQWLSKCEKKKKKSNTISIWQCLISAHKRLFDVPIPKEDLARRALQALPSSEHPQTHTVVLAVDYPCINMNKLSLSLIHFCQSDWQKIKSVWDTH